MLRSNNSMTITRSAPWILTSDRFRWGRSLGGEDQFLFWECQILTCFAALSFQFRRSATFVLDAAFDEWTLKLCSQEALAKISGSSRATANTWTETIYFVKHFQEEFTGTLTKGFNMIELEKLQIWKQSFARDFCSFFWFPSIERALDSFRQS